MVTTEMDEELKRAVISFRDKFEFSEDLINVKMTLKDQLIISERDAIVALFDSNCCGYGDKILHSKIYVFIPTGVTPRRYYYHRIHDSVYEQKFANSPFYKSELHMVSLDRFELSDDTLTLYVKNRKYDEVVVERSISTRWSLSTMDL